MNSYAKYADLVRLFPSSSSPSSIPSSELSVGWKTFGDFYYQYNLDFENGFPTTGLHATDERTLRMSIAAGADLTALIRKYIIFEYTYCYII